MKSNLSLEKQVEILAGFLRQEYPDKIINGGAIETAIQILSKRKPDNLIIQWIAEYAYKKANPESKMDTPSIVYEQVEKDFNNFLNN